MRTSLFTDVNNRFVIQEKKREREKAIQNIANNLSSLCIWNPGYTHIRKNFLYIKYVVVYNIESSSHHKSKNDSTITIRNTGNIDARSDHDDE